MICSILIKFPNNHCYTYKNKVICREVFWDSILKTLRKSIRWCNLAPVLYDTRRSDVHVWLLYPLLKDSTFSFSCEVDYTEEDTFSLLLEEIGQRFNVQVKTCAETTDAGWGQVTKKHILTIRGNQSVLHALWWVILAVRLQCASTRLFSSLEEAIESTKLHYTLWDDEDIPIDILRIWRSDRLLEYDPVLMLLSNCGPVDFEYRDVESYRDIIKIVSEIKQQTLEYPGR